MLRSLVVLISISFGLALGGCADDNGDAPPENEPHPEDWIFIHGAEAEEDLRGCRVCHGIELRGSGDAVSCFACHLQGPPEFAEFEIHPWDTFQGHFTFAQDFSWTGCATAACHGAELEGGVVGPSCFVAGCHLDNPPVPHADNFALPELHGEVAENQQIFCRNCHGQPPNEFSGGFVADPDILDVLLGDCTICHPAARAHPTNWQGTNDTNPAYQASHRTVDLSVALDDCALCHAVEPDRESPFTPAPSCFADQFTNTAGSATGCHPGGPSGLR